MKRRRPFRFLCRAFSHRYGFLPPTRELEFWWGCRRCGLVVDRIVPEPVPGRPDLVRLRPFDLGKLIGLLRGMAS